ncbi:RICIN domain-containing protein [Andreprevotia chitinilytica]|uniref:RICIN domain-containing protein n=1 Tax=Andreprevotia chitinilytica TaxID=396808 RepID=UPI00054F2875|nr:RICIN domain-containing protein [Andreprevotia chitinilytica]
MAFTPKDNSYYRITFKHSGLCMEAPTIHRGEAVLQAKPNVQSKGQLWRFQRIGQAHFMLVAKNSGKALDVPRSTHDDGAGLIQWDPYDSSTNQHFRLLPAGSGHYYLVARHSGKRICVKGGSKDASTGIVQAGDGVKDEYRIRLVLAEESATHAADRDFVVDANAEMRQVIIAIAGKAPKIGSGLQPLMELLWPAADPSKLLWEQMKRYVTELVREMIAAERLISLSNKLAGIQSSLQDYVAEDYGSPRKQGAFDGLLTALNNAEPDFFDERDPEKTLPYFVALGTIRLAALRELCESYKKIYGKDDDKPAVHLAALQKKIASYVLAANTAFKRAEAWRQTKIRVEHTKERSGISTNHTWAVVDDYDGFRREWRYNDTTGSGDGRAETNAKSAKQLREREVASQYGTELDSFFGPARLWRYLDPAVTLAPKKTTIEVLTGPFGAFRFDEFQDDPRDQPITAIDLYAGDHIDGIEMHYGGKSAGLHGKRGGRHYHFDLEAGESIIGVWGSTRNEVSALFFQTNKGRNFGGGGPGHAEWVGDPPDVVDATLYRIGGRKGTGHIEALSFVWRYTRDE